MTVQIAAAPGARHKLKSYVYFGEVDDGVWFEAGARSFLLRDRRLYPAAEKFVALLDAGHPVERILAGAPPALRPVFTKLMSSLVEHEMLTTLDDEYAGLAAGMGHAPENELYRLLEDRLDGRALSAAAARWRAARVTVTGGGYAMKAAAGALAAGGCRTVTLRCLEGAGALAASEIAGAAAERAAAHTGVVIGESDQAADLCLYVADVGDWRAAAAAEAAARTSGAPGVIAAVFAGHACVLPPTGEGEPGLDDLRHWLPAADAADADLSPTALSVLGCVAAQSALYGFFGFDRDERRGLVTLVAPELEIVSRPLTPAPRRRAAPLAAFAHAPRHELPDARPLERFETMKLALDPWFDPLLGAFSAASDDDIQQMPLLQYPLDVRDGTDGARRVIGWGLDLGEAGLRALAEAVATLARPLAPAGAAIGVAGDAATAGRAALIDAFAASAAFCATAGAGWMPLDALDDPGARVLARLLRYHVRDEFTARLRWSPLGPARIAEIWTGDRRIAAAAGDGVAAALIEALGRACSDVQLIASHGPGFWAGRVPAADTGAAAGDWRDALAPVDWDVRLGATHHAIDELALPAAVRCHYAVLAGNAR